MKSEANILLWTMPTLKLRYIVVLVLCIGSGLQSLLNNFAKIDVEKKEALYYWWKKSNLKFVLIFSKWGSNEKTT